MNVGRYAGGLDPSVSNSLVSFFRSVSPCESCANSSFLCSFLPTYLPTSVQETFDEMLHHQINLRPTLTTYSQVIRAACVSGNLESAMHYLGLMRQRRLVPEVRVYNWILYACIEKHETGILAEVVQMMEREGIQPNAVTQRAKSQIMRLLASRMRFVSDVFVGRLSARLGGAAATTTAEGGEE